VNFTDDYGDTVYVTGNPATSKHITGSFHDYIEIWQDGLDDQLGTTPADAVADAARKAHGDYPNKRLIVHFVQSHYPLVPDDRFQFEFWQGTDGLEFGDDTRASQVWEAIGLGLADPDDVWSAYRDNLEYVMDHAWDLIEDLDGKTVVHSDHGNALGSRSWPIPVKTYGHPWGCACPSWSQSRGLSSKANGESSAMTGRTSAVTKRRKWKNDSALSDILNRTQRCRRNPFDTC